MATLRVGDPLDKNTDVGAINSKQQLEQDRGARRGGRGGGRRDLPAAVPAAGEGLLVRADRLHERRAELPDRAGGDLRPGALRAHLPHAGRGGREGEQHAVRPLGRASGRRRARGSSGWRERLRAGVVWANTFNRFDPASPFGGYKESGFGREGGRHGLEPYLQGSTSDGDGRLTGCRSRRRTSSSSAARSRARSRGARTRPRGRTSRAPRARTCATPSARRAGVRRAGRARPRTTAARCSTGSPR